METNPILEKLAMIASKLGVSTETISKMTDEATKSQSAPAVTVTKVTVEPKEEILTDEQIDKMTEKEAKDYIKKMRDEDKQEETSDSPDITPVVVKKESNSSRLSKSPDMARVMGM